MTQRDGDVETPARTAAPTWLPSRTDLLVIGAGINGTAIARDAALRGLDVVVVERDDLAAGASAWNSRLIHGGIRYLEHGELRLVYESLRERGLLLRHAPHLVRPYPLLIPYFRHNTRPGWLLTTGMLLYDLLSPGKTTPRSRVLTRRRLLRHWPGLRRDGLRGGGLYYDAQVAWPERLSVENAVAAHQAGARIHTHVRAERLIEDGGRVVGARVVDELTGGSADIAAGAVLNATGANIDALLPADWSASRLIGGTKGTHLLVDPFPGAPPTGVHYEAGADARALLVLPWNGRYLLGTTDEFVEGDPADVRTDAEEVAYILAETNRLLPGAQLSEDDVVLSYVGVRPLPYAEAAGSSAEVSRDHIVHDHAPQHPGLWSVIGGKLTTHRALAEQTMRMVCRYLGVPSPRRSSITSVLGLPGGTTADWPGFCTRYLAATSFAREHAERLLRTYGTRVRVLEDLAAARPELRVEVGGILGAEIANAFENEFARTVGDVLLRRTMAAFCAEDRERLGREVADEAARLGYIESEQVGAQVESFLNRMGALSPERGSARKDERASVVLSAEGDG